MSRDSDGACVWTGGPGPRRLVILGAGTAGTMLANRLSHRLDDSWQIVVVELRARFMAAARLNDVLTVETEVGDIGRATSTWHQRLTRDGEPIATLEVTAAFTDRSGRPRRIPPEFVAAVTGGSPG